MQGIYKYVRRGKMHEEEKLACQDAVTSGVKEGVIVIAAADASSKNDFGRLGAEAAVEVLKQMLLHNFEELYLMEKVDLQYNLIIQVRNKLYELCEKHKIHLDDVKSTLMAFAYDRETGRAIMVHLGDGYIVAKMNEQYRVISYPENVGNRYCTYMTSTIPVADKIKVYRGEIEKLQKVYLLTDGWCEFIHKDAEILTLIQKEIEGECKLVGQDDLSVICMNLDD